VLAGAALVCALARPADGQFFGAMPVVDAGAIAKLATQVSKQVEAITVARNQLRTQVDNMRKLANPPLRSIAAAQANIDVLTRQHAALSYALRDLDAQFSATFGGWRTHANLRTTTRQQNERTLATVRGVLNAANASAQQLAVSSATFNAMKARMAGITSAQQAAELNGAVGIATAEEIALLRQQLAMQANLLGVMVANQVNRDLQGAAATAAFEAAGARPPVRRVRRGPEAMAWTP
jgi:P-type conjugative transfer protein TrbJ